MKTIQALRTKFNKEMETLKRTQVEMSIELKNSVVLLENSKERLTNKMNQNDKITGHKDKVEDLTK